MRDRILEIARSVLTLPTAPFREHCVRGHIREFCETRGIRVREDDFGNLIAEYGKGRGAPALAFAAHMDHPGFIIDADSRRGRTTALFHGGVEKEYFKGTGVRVYSDGREVEGRILSVHVVPKKKNPKRARLALEGDVKRGDLAMWDVPAFRVRGDRLSARACDDIAGCAAILAMLDDLARRKSTKRVLGVFTVAEEAGCQGAKYLGMRKALPRSTRIVAIETSRELPAARIGRGAIIRVGDSQRVFDPALTRFMEHVARTLAEEDKAFRFQRALMSGGSCEASVYQAFGWTAGAACVALGNYHNRDFRRKRIAAEYVSLSDLANLSRLFVGMVEQQSDIKRFENEKPPRLIERRGKLGERMFEMK